jgi:hypothetical protein
MELIFLSTVLVLFIFLYRHTHTRSWVGRVAEKSRLPLVRSRTPSPDRGRIALLEEERWREDLAAHQEVIDRLDRELEPYRPPPPPCTSEEHEHEEVHSFSSSSPLRRLCVPTAVDVARERLKRIIAEMQAICDRMETRGGVTHLVVVDPEEHKRFYALAEEGKALRQGIDAMEADTAKKFIHLAHGRSVEFATHREAM